VRDLSLHVNGEPRKLRVEDRKLLLDALREELGLTGAHAGCEHGVCGACTVLLDGQPVRSCLMLAPQAEGHELETVESLSEGREPSPLQQAFVDNLGLQCGFCTPGMLLTAKAFLAERPDPSEAEVRQAISANLCRCTGYEGIVQSILAAARANGEKKEPV
jgi:aerobic-type carbon monoxide dehydrogenase small subunit (CoxS/CutS family)